MVPVYTAMSEQAPQCAPADTSLTINIEMELLGHGVCVSFTSGDNSKLFFTVVLTVYTPGSRKHVLELFLKWEPMVHKRRFKELVFSPFLFRDRVGKVFVSDYRVSKAHHGGHYLCMLADQHLSWPQSKSANTEKAILHPENSKTVRNDTGVKRLRCWRKSETLDLNGSHRWSLFQ